MLFFIVLKNKQIVNIADRITALSLLQFSLLPNCNNDAQKRQKAVSRHNNRDFRKTAKTPRGIHHG